MLFVSVFTGAMDYLFQVMMGRALGPADYGVLGSLGAVSYFLFFFFERTMRVTTAKYVSEVNETGDKEKTGQLHSTIIRMVFAVGIICLVVFAALSKAMADYLQISEVSLVIIVGLISFFSCLFHVNLGMMQGLQRFMSLAMNNVIRSVLKLLLGLGLVALGFGLFGALGAILLGITFALPFSFYSIRDYLLIKRSKKSFKERRNDGTAREALLFLVPTMVTMAALAIPTNLDVIIVKHFFTSEDTGLYTAATVFGRLLLFIPVGLTTALFPKIVIKHVQNQDPRPLLARGLLFTGVATGVVTLLLYMFPGTFLMLFYGQKYMAAQDLLKYYGLMIYFFSLTQVLVFYHLARANFWFLSAFTAFMVLEVVAITILNTSLSQVIMVLLAMNIVLFLFSALWTFRGFEKPERSAKRPRTKGPGTVPASEE